MSKEVKELFIANVSKFIGSKERPAEEDKNGKMPVILNLIAGKCPDKRVLSGTIAENLGLETGNTYGMSVNEVEPDPEFGRRFNYTRLTSNLSMSEISAERKTLGTPQIINTSEPVEVGADEMRG